MRTIIVQNDTSFNDIELLQYVTWAMTCIKDNTSINKINGHCSINLDSKTLLKNAPDVFVHVEELENNTVKVIITHSKFL